MNKETFVAKKFLLDNYLEVLQGDGISIMDLMAYSEAKDMQKQVDDFKEDEPVDGADHTVWDQFEMNRTCELEDSQDMVIDFYDTVGQAMAALYGDPPVNLDDPLGQPSPSLKPCLVYTVNKQPVQLGDKVNVGGEEMVVQFFAPPHKPEASGYVTLGVSLESRDVGMTVYVGLIGAEWINRSDR